MKCPAPDCEVEISSGFMCTAHWYSLPERLRKALWAAFRAHKRGTVTRATLLKLRDRAIAHVSQSALDVGADRPSQPDSSSAVG